MINFDDTTKENSKVHNPSWPQVSDNPFRILFVGGPELKNLMLAL